MRVAKDKRAKLDLKSQTCIFLGYGDDQFGYRVLDLIDKKVIRSLDIIFMKEKTIAYWEMEKITILADWKRTTR